ncbi:MAG TPA: DUF1259 domain-containing protein [Symbiobacteriaceae bacterium]|nr:DUF1259 domain-containing protein [Symbiobacteriaceae bacterium]
MKLVPTKDLCSLCPQVGQILGGEAKCEERVCTVSIPRKGIRATILGRPIHSDEVLGVALVFEGLDAQGRALCLGEATLLEGEVSPFVRDMSRSGIRITAIHNHWMEDQPRLIYIHFQAVMDPERFAQRIAPTLKRLA